MNKILFQAVIALVLALLLATACAKRVDMAEAEMEQAKPEMEEMAIPSIPPPPAEGMVLAEAARKIPIENGPRTPVRKALSQDPAQRPCWAFDAENRCKPELEPGMVAFVGTSSGAATADGAVLNAYQNAVENLAMHCCELSGKQTPEAREMARARAYYMAGIHDRSYKLKNDAWSQQWQETFQDYKRTYFRAFVLLVISQEQLQQIVP